MKPASARRVLVFFPQCPWPVRSGAHRRCMEILEGLRDLGCVVRMCSTDTMDDGRWSEEGRRALQGMGIGIGGIWTGRTPWERRWHRLTGGFQRPRHLIDDPGWVPGSLARMVRCEIRSFRPDAVIHNYVLWWPLARIYRRAGVPAAIEMHDLLTLNERLRRKLAEAWPGGTPKGDDDPLLRSDCFDDPSLGAEPIEFDRLGEFPVISCISSSEQRQVDGNCHKSRSVLVPMTREAVDRIPPLEGPAIMPVGPNPFNLQGLHVLARSILPKVRSRAGAGDFTVRVTGAVPEGAPRAEGLEYVGFVEDLPGEFARSSFLVSPVFGGTGEQVKVLEAMASGLPVVALEGRFQESAVRDGLDGHRARTTDAFAEACADLWCDRELRARMGRSALDHVRATRSNEARRAALGQLLTALAGESA